jgi:hypothetical protein
MAKVNVKKAEAADGVAVPAGAGPVRDKTVTVTDMNGRRIKVQVINALQNMRLTRVTGEDAANQHYMMYALIAASAVEIDGDTVSFPHSRLELEAIIQRLDNAGVLAVTDGLKQLAGLAVASTEAEAENLPKAP